MREEISEKNYVDVINFTNIDNEDFEGMWGGKITVIKTGETKPFPRFLAYHYCDHLIDKILHRQEVDAGDKSRRDELEQKILGNISVTATPVASVEESVADEDEFEEVPQEMPESELESFTKKRGRPSKK